MRSAFIDKLLGRMDRVQPEELQQYLVRLAQDKRLLETIFDALQEGVIVTDQAGQISYANPAACGIFGLNPQTSQGRRLDQQVSGLNWQELAQSDNVVSRDLEIFYPENRYVNFYVLPLILERQSEPEDGADSRPLEPLIDRPITRKGKKLTQKLRRLESDEQSLAGFALIVRDITEERRSTQKMIESEQLSALTMLAAGVAHELGNPLNSLNIHLQVMERKLRRLPAEDQEKFREMLEISKAEVNRLHIIITQFLRAVRPTAPDLQLSDINALLEESLSFLNREIRDRGIRIEQELRGDLPNLPVDRDQLKQAFYNLVRNSSQAMKEGGILRIRSDMDDFHVRISFTDTGGGIPAEVMSKIFNPFFTTKSTGTGLGLLIVRRIVREHGGEIEIESQEGAGTTVTILLPLIDKRVRMLPDHSRETPPAPPNNDQTS